jgi:hypothetical protein
MGLRFLMNIDLLSIKELRTSLRSFNASKKKTNDQLLALEKGLGGENSFGF